MRNMLIGFLGAALVATMLSLPAGGPPLTGATTAEAAKKGQVREFEGRVLRINRSNKVFVQRRGDGRGKVRIKVNRNTRWDDLKGFGALRKGMKVETKARYNGKRWIAREVERD